MVIPMITRIGIIGDVHGTDDMLELGLEVLRTRACDNVLCVGDIADGPGSVEDCCRLLISNGVQG